MFILTPWCNVRRCPAAVLCLVDYLDRLYRWFRLGVWAVLSVEHTQDGVTQSVSHWFYDGDERPSLVH